VPARTGHPFDALAHQMRGVRHEHGAIPGEPIAAVTMAAEEEELATIAPCADNDRNESTCPCRQAAGVDNQGRCSDDRRHAGSRAPCVGSARGSGVATPGPHPSASSAGTIYPTVSRRTTPLLLPVQISAFVRFIDTRRPRRGFARRRASPRAGGRDARSASRGASGSGCRPGRARGKPEGRAG
jgi:hypothetical protein